MAAGPPVWHDPVGRGIAAFLNHQLHMATAGRSVLDFAGADLMEVRQGKVGLDHAGGLQRAVLINARQFGIGSNVIDHPGGAFVASNGAFATKRFYVAFDLGFQGGACSGVAGLDGQEAQNKDEKRGNCRWPEATHKGNHGWKNRDSRRVNTVFLTKWTGQISEACGLNSIPYERG